MSVRINLELIERIRTIRILPLSVIQESGVPLGVVAFTFAPFSINSFAIFAVGFP